MIQGSHTLGQEMHYTWHTLSPYLAAHSLVDASWIAPILF